MNLRVPKKTVNIVISWATITLSGNTLLYGVGYSVLHYVTQNLVNELTDLMFLVCFMIYLYQCTKFYIFDEAFLTAWVIQRRREDFY
jgi:hypothetical protein